MKSNRLRVRLPDRRRRTISRGNLQLHLRVSTSMAITISSSFDGGNIRMVNQDGDSVDVEIVKDHMSDFYQWFYFRVAGGAGREITLRITNCAGAAYPHGWPDYKGVMSLDREDWVRIQDTSYADG